MRALAEYLVFTARVVSGSNSYPLYLDKQRSLNNMIQSTRPTIFVIDDDTSVQRALARLLNSADYNVITFTSVDLFLELSDWPAVGCVLADIRMPGTQSMLLPKLLS